MIDYIKQNRIAGPITEPALRATRDELDIAIPIVADNVAELFYGELGDMRLSKNQHIAQYGRVDVKDFPNLAPPFGSYFVEYTPVSPERKLLSPWIGAHVISVDPKTSLDPPWSDASWIVSYDHYEFFPKHDRVVGPLIRHVIALDSDGEAVCSFVRHFPGYNIDEDYQYWCLVDLGPAYLTTCLMHCKNVTSEVVNHPPKLAKAYQKRHRVPLVKYQTVNIDPMRRILRSEGKAHETGIRKALHICRGHFRTYSPEKPLFGKVAGTFFVPMHTRGSAKAGINIPDYRVVLPSSQPANGSSSRSKTSETSV